MPNTTRTIRVRFDGSAKGLIAAAGKAGIAVEGFERQVKKSAIASSATNIGGGLVEALGSLPSVLKGTAIVAAAGIGAVMAPALASAIISGTLFAVGGGALAAGIIGAAKSPKVKAAWQGFARQATVVFERFSEPFIAPMVRAASTFGRALARAEPTIRRIGQTLAPVIDRLAPAFASMAEKALPGILAAAQASVPLFDVLARHAPKIGESISAFFDKIAAGSPGAQAFFDRFLGWVEMVLPKLGGFVTWLSDLGTKMDEFTKSPEFTELKTALIDLKDNVLSGVSGGFDKIKKSIEDNSATWKQLGKDITTVLGDAGPAVKYFVESTAASISFLIDVYARLYRILRNILSILEAIAKNYKTVERPLIGPGGGGAVIGDLPGRAHGGGVRPFHDYMVGEDGPEILRMGSTGGTVIPNDKIGVGSSAPIEVNVTVELDGEPVGRRVRTEISEHNRGLRRSVAMAGAR